jgi:CO dehydrogenase maturation factor
MGTTTIAIAGKGGTGKTTITALLIKFIKTERQGSILAIDGDPSSNLNLTLGLPLSETVGRIREDALAQAQAGGGTTTGISKHDWFEYRVSQALVESENLDLIAMGRPEGPGCYCAANNIIRNVIDRLGNDYDWVVIDNEAGMEHISRQTTRHIDYLFVVSDPTLRGLTAAQGIGQLVLELSTRGTRVSRVIYVVNRVQNGLPEAFLARAAEMGLAPLYSLPADPLVAELDLAGRPLIELGQDSILYRAVRDLAIQVGL